MTRKAVASRMNAHEKKYSTVIRLFLNAQGFAMLKQLKRR